MELPDLGQMDMMDRMDRIEPIPSPISVCPSVLECGINNLSTMATPSPSAFISPMTFVNCSSFGMGFGYFQCYMNDFYSHLAPGGQNGQNTQNPQNGQMNQNGLNWIRRNFTLFFIFNYKLKINYKWLLNIIFGVYIK